MKQFLVPLTACIALSQAWLAGEVVDSAGNGFTVRTTLEIKASPDDVYRKLVRNVGDWWSSEHTFSHNAHNLSIEEKPMGCFCEKLPDGGGVRHMEVIFLMPGKVLRMQGGLGPLLSLAATGSMEVALVPAGGGTRLQLTYSVAGYLPAGMNTWAAPVDNVLKEQLARLKNYAERGDPGKAGN